MKVIKCYPIVGFGRKPYFGRKVFNTITILLWDWWIFSSVAFWWIFEIFNIGIRNWGYSNVAEPQWLMFTLAFSTVVPAVFEASDFLMTTKLFSKSKLKKGWKITNFLLDQIPIFFGIPYGNLHDTFP